MKTYPSSDWPSTYYGLVLAVLMHSGEVCDIGQFDSRQCRLLKRAVKRGELSTHRAAGPFPLPKTAYAAPSFDFAGARKAFIDSIRKMAACEAPGRSHISRSAVGLRN
jgi:hypothetical protein